ncbi:MAG: hypothetical protein LBV47_03335 [Bacteroidales bacterium]|nr:hypothetical protein [Bacteroidales bacterium]
MEVTGYEAYSPEPGYRKMSSSVEFKFFRLGKGTRIAAEKKTFEGTGFEYLRLEDENYGLLLENKIKTESGSVISTRYYTGNPKITNLYRHLLLPAGRYYVVAIYKDVRDLGVYYHSPYALKYAGKYINIGEDSRRRSVNQNKLLRISAVIPADQTRYGHIDWVESDEEFPYEF